MNALVKTLLVGCLGTFSCASGDAPDEAYGVEPQEWEVEHVIDGDTIVVAGLGKVRLLGIDAPESVHSRLSVQPCGLDASIQMHQLTYRRRVRIEVSPGSSRDIYGRLLAVVWIQGRGVGPADINLRMVRTGMAKVETRWYFAHRLQYLAAEALARKEKRGIWAEKPCQ